MTLRYVFLFFCVLYFKPFSFFFISSFLYFLLPFCILTSTLHYSCCYRSSRLCHRPGCNQPYIYRDHMDRSYCMLSLPLLKKIIFDIITLNPYQMFYNIFLTPSFKNQSSQKRIWKGFISISFFNFKKYLEFSSANMLSRCTVKICVTSTINHIQVMSNALFLWFGLRTKKY